MSVKKEVLKFVKWGWNKLRKYASEHPEQVVEAIGAGVEAVGRIGNSKNEKYETLEAYCDSLNSKIGMFNEEMEDFSLQINEALQSIYDTVQELKEDDESLQEKTSKALADSNKEISSLKQQLDTLQLKSRQNLFATSALCGLGIVVAIVLAIVL